MNATEATIASLEMSALYARAEGNLEAASYMELRAANLRTQAHIASLR
jgi:hypothetical protein